MYSIPHWDFIPLVKTAKRVRKEVYKDIFPFIQQRREPPSTSPPQQTSDCLTTLIASGLNDTQIFDHIFTLMCSAHDTVAYTASFVCYLLAENLAVQDRLRCEILESVGYKQELTFEDVVGIKYLNQVISYSAQINFSGDPRDYSTLFYFSLYYSCLYLSCDHKRCLTC